MGLRAWLLRTRTERRARGLLATALGDSRMLSGTSLRRRHANRCVVQSFDVEGEEIVRIYFGIVRHPRPYAFSHQSHKVLESYVYDVAAGTIRRTAGKNLTRASGRDDD